MQYLIMLKEEMRRQYWCNCDRCGEVLGAGKELYVSTIGYQVINLNLFFCVSVRVGGSLDIETNIEAGYMTQMYNFVWYILYNWY